MEAYSVLMSVYERDDPEHLRQAVDSMLSQTVPPSELVLVCDGPLPPDLDRVVRDYQQRGAFQILRLPENQGLGLALRRGLPLCRHEYVARMDADDIALPDRMEKLLTAMERDPQICVIGGQIAEFSDEPGQIDCYRIVPTTPEEIQKRVVRRNPMNHMTVLLRKSPVLEAGGYRDMPGFEDYDLWARLLARGCLLRNIDDVCCYVRAGEKLYRRRGGLAYFGRTVRMQRQLLALGLAGRLEILGNLTVRFAAAVLPNRLRSFLFQKLMRRRSVREETA